MERGTALQDQKQIPNRQATTLMFWNTATKTFRNTTKTEMGDPCQVITTFNLLKKDHINIWHMHSQKISSHQESMSSHKRRKQKIRQETLNTNYSNDSTKNIQTREHGWLCKWNHKQAYQCLPIINKLSWVILPQVEFWSKESKNRHTDGQPGPVTWRNGRSSDSRFYLCYFCIILNRASLN